MRRLLYVAFPCLALLLIVLSIQTGIGAVGAPTSLTSIVNGNTVTLTWVAPGDSDPSVTYLVEVGTAAGRSDLGVFDTGSGATTITAGAPSGTYFVRVRARSSSTGLGPPSNEAIVSVGMCTSPPGVPAVLVGTIVARSVTLNWNAGAGGAPDSHVVEVGSITGASDLAVFPSSAATTLRASAPRGTFYVRVRARNACGISGASNEVRLIVRGIRPIEFAIVSEGANAGNQGSSFRRDGQVLAVLGRGINVAAINPDTGALLGPVMMFDTWGTRNTGTAMTAMVDYLESVPNGALLLIGVHDEAGLTFDSFACLPHPQPDSICCRHNGFAWSERGMSALEALGAREIRRYCYRNSYALIAFKGEGAAMGEHLVNAVRTDLRYTLYVD